MGTNTPAPGSSPAKRRRSEAGKISSAGGGAGAGAGAGAGHGMSSKTAAAVPEIVLASDSAAAPTAEGVPVILIGDEVEQKSSEAPDTVRWQDDLFVPDGVTVPVVPARQLGVAYPPSLPLNKEVKKAASRGARFALFSAHQKKEYKALVGKGFVVFDDGLNIIVDPLQFSTFPFPKNFTKAKCRSKGARRGAPATVCHVCGLLVHEGHIIVLHQTPAKTTCEQWIHMACRLDDKINTCTGLAREAPAGKGEAAAEEGPVLIV